MHPGDRVRRAGTAMNRRATSMKTPRPVPVAAALIAGMVLAPSGLRWQPVGRRRPVTECRLRVGGCRLGLHACSRCAELSRPQQQRNPSEDRRTGSPCRDLPVSGIPECLPGHASLLRQRIVRRPGPAVLAGRRLTTGTGAADDDARADDRPLQRAHGIPDWPDPTIDPQGGPFFDLCSQAISRSASAPTGCRTGPIRPSAPRVAVPCST